tara:strand:+ start:41 stop:427 length:387 start_codon:yes stop_codon:yes gene_type:complete
MIVEFENIKRKKTQDLICDILQFGKNKLFPRHKHIFINIIRIRNQGVNGDCMYEDGRDFSIRFDGSLSPLEIIKTLFHELVHVNQYLRKVDMSTDLPYNERPYEQEAYFLEEQLTEAFYAERGEQIVR